MPTAAILNLPRPHQQVLIVNSDACADIFPRCSSLDSEDDRRWGRRNVSRHNSLSQDYTNLGDHISQTSIDTPRFKQFTLLHFWPRIVAMYLLAQAQ